MMCLIKEDRADYSATIYTQYLFCGSVFGEFSFLSSILSSMLHHLCRIVRKPVFGVPDEFRHKPGCTAAEDG